MDVEIIAVRMRENRRPLPPTTRFEWVDVVSGRSGWCTANELIKWLEQEPNTAWVKGAEGRAEVEITQLPRGAKYLRTRYQGDWSTHLLDLPEVL